MRKSTPLGVLGSGFAVLLSATPARAGDAVAAQGLFDQAKKLMAAQKFAEACPKFEESERLDPALGTLLNLANCYEKDGKVGRAWSTFLELASKADAAGQKERARIGRERAAALEPRLSKIVVNVATGSDSAGLEITRDGVSVGQAQLGTEVPTDPGQHEIAATAPGKKPWSTTVTLSEGKTSSVTVPPLVPLPAQPTAQTGPGPGPATTAASLPTETPEQAPRSSGMGTQKILALVAGGLGVAGIGVGSTFGIISMSKHSQAKDACPSPTCPTMGGSALWHDAVSAGNIATVAYIAGAAALGGGVILWLTAKDPNRAPGVQMGLGWGDIQVAGRF